VPAEGKKMEKVTKRARPGVQDLHDGTYRAQILLENGDGCVLQLGEVCKTLSAAGNASCDQAEAAIPDGEWNGDWLEGRECLSHAA
jgi:hypothetical protein